MTIGFHSNHKQNPSAALRLAKRRVVVPLQLAVKEPLSRKELTTKAASSLATIISRLKLVLIQSLTTDNQIFSTLRKCFRVLARMDRMLTFLDQPTDFWMVRIPLLSR